MSACDPQAASHTTDQKAVESTLQVGTLRALRSKVGAWSPQKYPDSKLVEIPVTYVFANCQEERNRTTDRSQEIKLETSV